MVCPELEFELELEHVATSKFVPAGKFICSNYIIRTLEPVCIRDLLHACAITCIHGFLRTRGRANYPCWLLRQSCVLWTACSTASATESTTTESSAMGTMVSSCSCNAEPRSTSTGRGSHSRPTTRESASGRAVFAGYFEGSRWGSRKMTAWLMPRTNELLAREQRSWVGLTWAAPRETFCIVFLFCRITSISVYSVIFFQRRVGAARHSSRRSLFCNLEWDWKL